jgi:phage-related baseplate assembly protein
VLSRSGDGTASADLLAAVRKHFARDDVRPETDLVTVQSAQIKRYKIRVVAKINAGPDSGLTKLAAETHLQAYADSCHHLEGRVDPSWIDYTLHAAGAVQLEILEPLAPIATTASEAPYCTAVEVEVRIL